MREPSNQANVPLENGGSEFAEKWPPMRDRGYHRSISLVETAVGF
jgi:hypothetical protein